VLSVKLGPDHFDPDIGRVGVSQGSVSGLDPLVFSFGEIVAGASGTATLEVTVATNTTGLITNRATLIAADAIDIISFDNNVVETTLVRDNDGDGNPDFVDGDDDGDFMPDVWEIQHGLNQTNPADAAVDGDGDGARSVHEYIADTDPNNVHSVFALSLRRETHGMEIAVDTSNQRLYTVERADMLAPETWISLPGMVDLPGQGPDTTYLDTSPGAKGAYRIGVEVP
jgi:hypothetical protein